MLINVFENRNRYFSNLIKLGDFLGRSLRENVELFSIDGNEATFITESNKVIKGTYDSNKPTVLQNIKVEDSSIFENKDEYSKIVDNKVSNFLSNIIENDLINAENSFDDVLKLWEIRLQFDVTKSRLQEKAHKLDKAKVTSTPEFKRVLETKDLLVSFLKKNSKVISQIKEMSNAVKLTSAISKCFNLPKVDYETLQENSFSIPGRLTQNLYEHLTKTELINKELNESKEQFNSIWSTDDQIVNLVSMIYEEDHRKIYESLAKAVHKVPYFAFTTKRQLNETFRTILNVLEQDYSEGRLKKFTSFIYETKKPVKNYLIGLLNEKYGINVSNLTETPTFSTLARNESLIFEALSLIVPKNSNLRRVLSEMSVVLKDKGGVETIDVADFLNEVFTQANYKNFINETSLLNYLDFNRVADDLGKIGTVLKMIQGNMGGGAADLMGQDIGGLTQALQPQGEEGTTDDDQYGAEVEVPEGAEEEMPEEEMAPEMEEEMPMPPEGEDNDDIASPAMDPEQAAADAMGMEGEEEAPMPEEDGEDLLGNLKELEDLIAQLKGDMGVEGEAFAGEETPEEEAMEDHEMGEENEEDEEGDGDINIDVDTADADADSDSDDDEVHIDIDSHKDEEDADEEEEEEEEDEDEEEEDEDEEKQEESSHKKLIGKQHRLDKNKNGRLDKMDFKMLRKGKK